VNQRETAALWAGVVWLASALAFSSPVGKAATTRDGVYRQGQATAGKNTYAEKCGSCHLDNLAGGRNESPALKGGEFVLHWSGKPLRALYSRIISTMPLSDPGSLTEKETLNLVAFILQANGFRSGKSALQSPEELNKIQFEAAK
jgi:mono/diheme cytochrome c family protein